MLWALHVYADMVPIGSFVELTAPTGTSPGLRSHTALENHRRGVALTDRSVAFARGSDLVLRMTQFHNCPSWLLFS